MKSSNTREKCPHGQNYATDDYGNKWTACYKCTKKETPPSQKKPVKHEDFKRFLTDIYDEGQRRIKPCDFEHIALRRYLEIRDAFIESRVSALMSYIENPTKTQPPQEKWHSTEDYNNNPSILERVEELERKVNSLWDRHE